MRCVSDALDVLGIDGALDGIRPLWEGARVIGRAVTTKLAAGPAPAGRPPVHLGAWAIEAFRPGDAIVIDNGGWYGMGSWHEWTGPAAGTRATWFSPGR
jgi:regulator of RNase E activity RraA